MSEKDKQNAEYAYELSKWNLSIKAGFYWLERDQGKQDQVYKSLKEWVYWMVNEGYRASDKEVKEKSQTCLPGITEEVWEGWVGHVNQLTSIQK